MAQRRGLLALAGRETRRVLSLWTQTILPPVVTASLFLAVFGGALGSRIRITPLALVGGVFYSARTLAEPWETLTRFDPVYYLVDAARAGFTGFHEADVALSLTVSAIVAAAAFSTTAALVASGWRLKP